MVLSQTGRQHKMRKIAIESSHKITLRLVLGGKEESGSALSPFGPVRAGLITTQRTNEDQVLTELLNCLERKITEANIKSLEVLNTYLSDTEHPVKPTSFGLTPDHITTDTCNECGNDLPAEGQSKCLDCLEKAMLVSNS
jgi:hypothetical protein